MARVKILDKFHWSDGFEWLVQGGKRARSCDLRWAGTLENNPVSHFIQ